MLEDAEDQLDRSCEKWRSVTKCVGGEGEPTNNKMKEGLLDWLHLVKELPFKTHNRRKDRGKNLKKMIIISLTK